METKHILSVSLCIWFATESFCVAAAVSAGTQIIVRTNTGISSHATAGNHFTATLDRDIVANGNVAVRAGAPVSGVVESSRGGRSTTSSEPLTLTLTSITANGRSVSIKTDSIQPQGAKTTRSRRGSFSFGENIFPVGTKLEFRLARSAQL
jgi:hypothetical protein